MPTPDGLTEQTAEVQSALRQVLQESGAAGTGPLTLPPPADITSTQQHSESAGDPFSYGNTLNVDLYRDADGKVWTQPGPGHQAPNISMRITRQNGEWQVVAEHRKVTRVRKSGKHTFIDRETVAKATSGAPVSELSSVERFEQFSPQSAKEAIRQTIARLQAKGAIYVYDPNAPVPQQTAGVLSNGSLALAAVAAAGAIAAFAGIVPFAGAPASAAQTGAVQPGSGAQISAAPAAAAAAASACGPGGSQNGAEDLNLSGGVTAHVTQDCGAGPTGGAPRCNPVQVLPYGKTDQSYTYDWYGGFFAGGVEYELHFPGSGIGSSFSVQFPRDPTAPNRGHVTMTSYANFAPASVWQSPDSAPTGAISWTPTTVTMSNVTLTSLASAPNPAAPVTMNGTWAVHCGAGAPGAAATGAAPTAAASVAAVVTPVTTGGATVAAAAPAPSGPSPWGPGLAVIAVASAAAGLALRSRRGASVPTSPQDRPRDCATLEAALRDLQARLVEYKADPKAPAMRPEIQGLQSSIWRVEEALTACRAGTGPDVVPAGPGGGLATLGYTINQQIGHDEEDEQALRGPGFEPTPPPAAGPDGDDPKDKRQEIG